MEILEAMHARHSVRQYEERSLVPETAAALCAEIDRCNEESGLHIQLVTDEPRAFDSTMAHYGSFAGVTNYLVMVGPKGRDLDEKCGYYGERLVLLAQQLGLNTCWVGLTFKKIPAAFSVGAGEKLCIVIALGYGKTQGTPHKQKSASELCDAPVDAPAWFRRGVEAAMLAPTAVNQQKYHFSLSGNTVTAKAGLGFFSKVDLGIVKYHFEIGAGKENFIWA